jgi:putative SOS response-associated peptidase YedK
MCGRFTLTVDTAELQQAFAGFQFPVQAAPRYNIAPSQPVLALANDGAKRADFFIWGLIPSWSKDPTIGARMINARAETLGEKPSFRGPFRYKRCLIPADGFYEWKQNPGEKVKTPHYIRIKNRQPFAFAGLWDEWLGPDGSQVKTCTIITTAPNPLVAGIHNRMPVILRPESYADWLAPVSIPPEQLNPLLTAFPADEMEAYPVSRLVNQARLDIPEMIQPLNTAS